ncbi:uncharacterized protein TNIN_198001 [Trichonephila inaurata madagascariensis]|uniref:Uncharacterized protein n=1 Tax=Trichonephila inaurata madagascariensis TaxID=2747483 RepID=A0A8X6MI43_9ARAC|nr:uncharacterized protein TNIN_198001 [Trichonephila inaurata madagascariensis]
MSSETNVCSRRSLELESRRRVGDVPHPEHHGASQVGGEALSHPDHGVCHLLGALQHRHPASRFPGEWQRGRPSLYVSALWSVLGPREQRHQPPVVLLGEQTIPQVRCPDISMWKNPGCSLGQTKRLPVPGVSHDGGCKLAIIIISLEKVPAQEGFADLQRKVQVHQGWSHECDLEFRLFLQGVRIKAFQKSLSSLKYLEFAAFFSKEKAWKIICAET